jgi:hypothetical protein
MSNFLATEKINWQRDWHAYNQLGLASTAIPNSLRMAR